MGIETTIAIDDSELKNIIKKVRAKFSNLQPAMSIVGEILLTSIQRNFEVGGRPQKWTPLKKATIKQRTAQKKWPGQILIRTGVSGGLLGSISYRAAADHVTLSANKKYAAIHHFGGKAGRGHKVLMPARPYMMVQDEDWAEIKAALGDYLMAVVR